MMFCFVCVKSASQQVATLGEKGSNKDAKPSDLQNFGLRSDLYASKKQHAKVSFQ